MRPPRFWSNPPDAPGLAARALTPLAALYAGATARRAARPGHAPGVPVICVGNVNAGGTGKTPTVMALLMHLMARGAKPHVVSRGYGGSTARPTTVDPARHTAAEVGDEPLLLAQFAPVHVAPDRAEAARLAVEAGANVIVMDDGFQNPALAKDLSLLVVDAGQGFGNGRVIPAGPLREPPEAALARAGLVLAIGTPAERQAFRAAWGARIHAPMLEAALAPLKMGMPWQGLRVMAFAGIGRPEKFFATLKAEGATLVRAVPLGDHQPYTRALLDRLAFEAREANAQLVTTEKDAVRLPASFRPNVLTLPVRLEIEDTAALDAALEPLGL